MTHCCFSCTLMKSNKYLGIFYATSKYQVYIVVACNPMTTWYALYQLLPIGVICIWSKYNTERQSHLLSRHFSPAPSFHSPFLSISSTIFLFTLPFFLVTLLGIFNFLRPGQFGVLWFSVEFLLRIVIWASSSLFLKLRHTSMHIPRYIHVPYISLSDINAGVVRHALLRI